MEIGIGSELTARFEYYTGRRVKIIAGPHKGKTGRVLGPSSCFHFDVRADGTREVLENVDKAYMIFLNKKK